MDRLDSRLGLGAKLLVSPCALSFDGTRRPSIDDRYVLRSHGLGKIICASWPAAIRDTTRLAFPIGSMRLFFFDCPPWVFNAAYVTYFILVVITLFLVPPRLPWRRREDV